MKILYDHQIFTMQKWGGVSRYFSELIKDLSETDGFDIETSVKFTNNEYLSNLSHYKGYSFFPGNRFRGKVRLQNQLNRYCSKRIIRKSEFDIFHPTYYEPYYISDIKNKPLVVTVYDMIHERLPSFFSKNDKTTENKRRVVKRADKIIAISKKTREDVIEIFGVDERKVSVIYLGNSLNFQKEDGKINGLNLPKRFILYVGIRKWYKNFAMLINSIAPLIKHDVDLYLVCAGGGIFNQSENELLKSNGINKKSIHLSCNDETLAGIYRNASCLVFPSLYEGFGLPVLEAFAAQCPVVCSNRGSLPEIGGDAANYFDPQSQIELHDRVHSTLYDEKRRAAMIETGLKRAGQFSWEKTVSQTRQVYESLL